MIDDAPAMKLTVRRERREAVVVTGKGHLAERTGRGFAVPADRTGRHVRQLQASAGDGEIALVRFGGVDALPCPGKFIAVVDLAPATQALAVGLELRIHRPDLLGAGLIDEDDRDVAEDQAGRSDRRIGGVFEGNERLQERKRLAVVGIGTHLAGTTDDDHRLGGGRQEHLLDRRGVGRDDEGRADGHLAAAAEAFAFGQTDRGQERLAGVFLAHEHESRLRAFGVPDIQARQAGAADRDRLQRGDDRFDGALAGFVERRAIDDADLLDGTVGETKEDQSGARIAADRGHAPSSERRRPIEDLGPVLGP